MTPEDAEKKARQVAEELEAAFRSIGVVTTAMYDFGIPIIASAIREAVEAERERSKSTAFLIERYFQGDLYYWSAATPPATPYSSRQFGESREYGDLLTWGTDPNAAIRFLRLQDAQVVQTRLGGHGRVAEHSWFVDSDIAAIRARKGEK